MSRKEVFETAGLDVTKHFICESQPQCSYKNVNKNLTLTRIAGRPITKSSPLLDDPAIIISDISILLLLLYVGTISRPASTADKMY